MIRRTLIGGKPRTPPPPAAVKTSDLTTEHHQPAPLSPRISGIQINYLNKPAPNYPRSFEGVHLLMDEFTKEVFGHFKLDGSLPAIPLHELAKETDHKTVECMIYHLKSLMGVDALLALARVAQNPGVEKPTLKLCLSAIAEYYDDKACDPKAVNFAICVSNIVSRYSSDHEMMRIAMCVARRVVEHEARNVFSALTGALYSVAMAYHKGDLKTFVFCNVVMMKVAPFAASQLELDLHISPALLGSIQLYSASTSFASKLHEQAVESSLEILTLIAVAQDEANHQALIGSLVVGNALRVACNLLSRVPGKYLSVEQTALDLLAALLYVAENAEILVKMQVVELVCSCTDAHPVEALRVLALISMTKTGALQIAAQINIMERLSKLLAATSMNLEASCLTIGKNLLIYFSEYLKELVACGWLEYCAATFTRCVIAKEYDSSAMRAATAFMIISTSMSQSVVDAFVKANVIPAALNVALVPDLEREILLKVFELLDHLCNFSKGAESMVSHKGAEIVLNAISTYPEDRDLVIACLMVLDHLAAAGDSYGKSICEAGGKDVIQLIMEAYGDDRDVAQLCTETNTLLVLDSRVALNDRVFAAEAIKHSEAARLRINSEDPLQPYRNLLLSGAVGVSHPVDTVLRKPAAGAQRCHLVVNPNFSALIIKDSRSQSSRFGMFAGPPKPPRTIWFRDIRSVYEGTEYLQTQMGNRPCWTLSSRGLTTVFEFTDRDEVKTWVDAMHVILHLVRRGDTRFLNLKDHLV